MLRAGPLIRALFAVERYIYRRAAVVSTLTAAMRTRILEKGVAQQKVVTFRQWAESSFFAVSEGTDERLRTSLGLGGKIVIVHAGNMGVKQGLEVVLEAASLSREDSSLHYLLVGDGAERSTLQERAREMTLPNLTFLPLQMGEDYLNLLAGADVCLITQRRDVADIVFPSKIPPLLAAARPLIASVSMKSEVARVILEAGAGLVVEPESGWALRQAILDLARDPERRAAMGRSGRAYAAARWKPEAALNEMEHVLIGASRRLAR